MDVPVVANVLGTLGAVSIPREYGQIVAQESPLTAPYAGLLVYSGAFHGRIRLIRLRLRPSVAYTPNRGQLPTTQCDWSSVIDDDVVGLGGSPSWSIQYC